MLKGELRKCYFVYPSLCTFRYSFDELRSVLADPFGHSALPQSENYYRSLDFPLDIQPFEMLPSRHGGGIIAAQAAAEPDERWLPECVLHSIADPRTPQGMESFRRSVTCSSLPARVYVLEPQNEPFANIRRETDDDFDLVTRHLKMLMAVKMKSIGWWMPNQPSRSIAFLKRFAK